MASGAFLRTSASTTGAILMSSGRVPTTNAIMCLHASLADWLGGGGPFEDGLGSRQSAGQQLLEAGGLEAGVVHLPRELSAALPHLGELGGAGGQRHLHR